ncbi:hypothetical protein [Halobellus rubicundus]|uniref:Uncharacterized protein n=1 Tax=Halobellus rubicundus TaxID=2996466 RepID=A0ABD5MCC3_9EURY
MAANTRATDRDSATDTAVYLPAGIPPSAEADRLTRLWQTLFSHRVDPPK